MYVGEGAASKALARQASHSGKTYQCRIEQAIAVRTVAQRVVDPPVLRRKRPAPAARRVAGVRPPCDWYGGGLRHSNPWSNQRYDPRVPAPWRARKAGFHTSATAAVMAECAVSRVSNRPVFKTKDWELGSRLDPSGTEVNILKANVKLRTSRRSVPASASHGIYNVCNTPLQPFSPCLIKDQKVRHLW